VEEQRMTEGEVINVLKLANTNELPYLQGKVEYFRNEINKLEFEKTKCINELLVLTNRIDELRETQRIRIIFEWEKRRDSIIESGIKEAR
jgi:hypothetical protein